MILFMIGAGWLAIGLMIIYSIDHIVNLYYVLPSHFMKAYGDTKKQAWLWYILTWILCPFYMIFNSLMYLITRKFDKRI